MDLKEFIGYNAFQTAENVYALVKTNLKTGMKVEDIIPKIYTLQYCSIEKDDIAFAKTLFQYLLTYQNKREILVKRFIENFAKGSEPMKALSDAANSLTR